MFEEIRSAVATLEGVVRALEPRTVDGSGAVVLVELFAQIERLGAAGKALSARRVDETNAFRDSGHRSAGQLLADVSGTTVGAAESTLRAVKRLDEQPVVADAFRAGELSETATREISYAASKDPDAQEQLVGYARRKRPIKGLKERCARVVAASVEDDQEWDRHLHETREGRLFQDRGHLRLDVRFAPDEAAGVYAAVEAETDLVFRDARAAGRKEARAAYVADAVANLLLRGPRKPIDARLDVTEAALERGHVVSGEKCEIPGLGPIPVTAAKRMLRDARVSVMVRDDTDKITHVSSVTRTVPAKLRRWLEAAYPVCGRHACENSRNLVIDHIQLYSEGGILDEHNAWRICTRCDHLKQHCGWVVVGHPGDWDLVPPDDARARPPDDPDDPDPP
jgi:5-methylcytosine-specific restriction endonuclease McrA